MEKSMIVLITGGTGYLGKSMTKWFSENNHNIVYVTGRSQTKFDNCNFNSNVIFINYDYNNDDLEVKLKEHDIKQIDVLINNATFNKPSAPLQNVIDDFMYGISGTVGIYYKTVISCIHLLQENSKIINIGSMYGIITPDFTMYETESQINPIEYGVGKAGVHHLTKYLAKYLAPRGINVNCIVPGAFPSTDTQRQTEFISKIINRTPLKRIGQPEDLLGLVDLLSSSKSNFITGQLMIVDGGFTIGK